MRAPRKRLLPGRSGEGIFFVFAFDTLSNSFLFSLSYDLGFSFFQFCFPSLRTMFVFVSVRSFTWYSFSLYCTYVRTHAIFAFFEYYAVWRRSW